MLKVMGKKIITFLYSKRWASTQEFGTYNILSILVYTKYEVEGGDNFFYLNKCMSAWTF